MDNVLDKRTLIKIFEHQKTITKQFNHFGTDKHAVCDATIAILEQDVCEECFDEQEAIADLYGVDTIELSSIFEYLNGIIPLEDILYEKLDNFKEFIEGNVATELQVCAKLCGDCPFANTSMKGFLADYTIEDFEAYQRGEFLLPCHKLMPQEGLSPEETMQQVKSGKLKLCRGYVESIIKSAKAPIDKSLSKAVKAVREQGLSDRSMSIFEFRKFHTL